MAVAGYRCTYHDNRSPRFDLAVPVLRCPTFKHRWILNRYELENASMKSYALIRGSILVGLLPMCLVPADSDAVGTEANAVLVADPPVGGSPLAQPWEQPFTGSQPVQEQSIPAEVMPVPGKSNAAALALQRLGFRVLHIGLTISVEGSESLWNSVFGVSFETRKKRVVPEIEEGGDVTYRRAIAENLKIPADLEHSIADVAFMEPPEFY